MLPARRGSRRGPAGGPPDGKRVDRIMYLKKYHIHFVGIGGIGMSGIAELLLNLGYRVSGSDLKTSDITDRLASLGGAIQVGHAAERIAGADVVVVSSAVRPDNPEVLAAQRALIPVIPRAEMLAELMRLKYSVAVAGAHGKTTTTSIVAEVLAGGGLDPTVVIGGKLISIGTNAVLGKGDFIVAEADESDGSFLRYSPAIAVVTNIDREHLDFYPDLRAIQRAFLQFIDRIPFYGLAVLCLDNEPIQDLIPQIKKRYTTYGVSRQADFQIRNVVFEGRRSRFSVYRRRKKLGHFKLNLPGIHNVYNATASIAVAVELDIPMDRVQAALQHLAGVQRRLEVKGEAGGVIVVDDYGHHPTEIKMTLQAARDCWPERRMLVVFQPHRYTRTRALFDEFSRAFYQSDALVVLPIYAASEDPIEGVSGQALCEGIKAHGHKQVTCVDGIPAAVSHLKTRVAPGDLLLTLGAGDVWKVGAEILKGLQMRNPDDDTRRTEGR
jgi:UDP-N-acetylmuramate--alanine ligase